MSTPRNGLPRLVGTLSVNTALGAAPGDTRIRLLEAIGRYGSISKAAKSVPLSYKAAWDALDALNNLADAPLVESSVGGRHGGGTHLTDYGRRLIALYRAVEQEYQAAVDRVSRGLDESATGEQREFQPLLKRMSMRTSARNQLVGTLISLNMDEMSAEVELRLDDRTRLVAIVTRDSAAALELKPGSEVLALVKASSVMLATDPGLRTSALNHLWGQVSRIHEGPVAAEVTLVLPGGRTLTAVITPESLGRLDLLPGRAACAVFQASNVILVTVG